MNFEIESIPALDAIWVHLFTRGKYLFVRIEYKSFKVSTTGALSSVFLILEATSNLIGITVVAEIPCSLRSIDDSLSSAIS